MQDTKARGALAAKGPMPPAPPPQIPGKVDPNDPKVVDLFNLLVARTMDALAKVGPQLDASLKADPIQGAVHFGTRALRSVVMAAMRAGKNIPFEIVVNAGMQVIKELASIANEKGYLQDSQIATFLKEVFQQSIAQYTKLDMDEGMLDKSEVAQIAQKMGMGAQAPRGALARGNK
jgi:hypothetical protein